MFQKIQALLSSFGQSIIKTIQETSRRFGKDATGQTISSLDSAIEIDADLAIELNVVGSKVFQYIEQGRPAGAKLPPKGALLEWMRIRGIEEAKEFIIRRSIAQKGIAPTPIIETSIIEIKDNFERNVAPKAIANLAQMIVDSIKQGLQF